MQNLINFPRLALLVLTFFSTQTVFAMSLDWSGKYRFDALDISNPSMLEDQKKAKAYWLQHFELGTEIIANDALRVKSTLMMSPAVSDSQLGQTFGNDNTSAGDPSVLSESNDTASFGIKELYARMIAEHGVLTVGRRTLGFGLGMTYSKGEGEFDHWYDSIDGISYKIFSGNLSFEPMFARGAEGDLGEADDVIDFYFRFLYESSQSDLQLGAIYRNRRVESYASDLATDGSLGGGTSATIEKAYDVRDVNFFIGSKPGSAFSYGVELGFQTGNMGLFTTGGDEVKAEGTGIASEFSYQKAPGQTKYSLLFGYASGDDPSTDEKYEGYYFDRNYDVAMLMLNHPLGQVSAINGPSSLRSNSADVAENSFDDARVSNVLYFSPRIAWNMGKEWDFTLALTMANTNYEVASGAEASLGTELDLHFDYKPYENMTWRTSIGYLSPGGAFAGGSNLPTGSVFGWVTQAAFSF
jgi:hypothetical protein